MATTTNKQTLKNDWKAQADAYYGHHFKCETCIAGGRGVASIPRCAMGKKLWDAYKVT